MNRIKVKTIKNNIDKIENKKMSLDKYQEKILSIPLDKHIRIIACAGSGKTTTILYKIKHLIENYNIKPNRIMCNKLSVEEFSKRKEIMSNSITEIGEDNIISIDDKN
jgi:superfamily I DNA/RNA helicase